MDIFSHTIPVLISCPKGNIEILIAFVATNDLSCVPPYARDSAIQLESDDDVILAGVPVNIENIWVIPSIVRARRLIGPIEENIPGGDSGELVSPNELLEILNDGDVDLLEILSNFRDNIDDPDDGVAKIIDRLLKKQRGY